MGRTTGALLVAAMLVGIGCGDEATVRPPYRVGVGQDTQAVASLDDGQLQEVCESLDVYVDTWVSFDAIAHVACLPTALVLSRTATECHHLLDGCTDLFPEPIRVSGRVRSQELCVSDLRSCEATVAEIEGCANVNLDRVVEVTGWSCDLRGDPNTVRTAREYEDTVSVCTDLSAACNRFATVGPE